MTDGPPVRPPCPNPRIPPGELQNKASGPSVFGIVVGGDPGFYDAFGGTECGLAGVRICQMGTSTCTDSDAAGQFVLGGLPSDRDIEITFEKPDHVKMLRPLHIGNVPLNLDQVRLVTYDPAVETITKTGTAFDPNKGVVLAVPIAAGDGIGGFVLPADVVITLAPAGPAPLYSIGGESADSLLPDELDPTLAATRFGGWAIIPNVDPGDYAVRFERNGKVCNQALPGFGYGADAEGAIRIKVVGGWDTGSIAAFCP